MQNSITSDVKVWLGGVQGIGDEKGMVDLELLDDAIQVINVAAEKALEQVDLGRRDNQLEALPPQTIFYQKVFGKEEDRIVGVLIPTSQQGKFKSPNNPTEIFLVIKPNQGPEQIFGPVQVEQARPIRGFTEIKDRPEAHWLALKNGNKFTAHQNLQNKKSANLSQDETPRIPNI